MSVINASPILLSKLADDEKRYQKAGIIFSIVIIVGMALIVAYSVVNCIEFLRIAFEIETEQPTVPSSTESVQFKSWTDRVNYYVKALKSPTGTITQTGALTLFVMNLVVVIVGMASAVIGIYLLYSMKKLDIDINNINIVIGQNKAGEVQLNQPMGPINQPIPQGPVNIPMYQGQVGGSVGSVGYPNQQGSVGSVGYPNQQYNQPMYQGQVGGSVGSVGYPNQQYNQQPNQQYNQQYNQPMGSFRAPHNQYNDTGLFNQSARSSNSPDITGIGNASGAAYTCKPTTTSSTYGIL
jgi:hypothetical protein